MPLMMWVRHGNPVLAAVERNQTPEVASFNQGQAMRMAKWLNTELATREWIAGDRFTIADIAAVTAVGYLDVRAPEHPWRQRHPTLASYHDRLATRPSFRATTPVPQTIRDRVV